MTTEVVYDAASVAHGRELAAQAIEAEAREYEKQFGVGLDRGGASSGLLFAAARIARGEDIYQDTGARL